MTTENRGTTFGVSPDEADWYYCAELGGESYVDGYAAGDEPTQEALQEHSRCQPSWEAGMMHVHDEDVEAIAATREVECGKCGRSYEEHDATPPLNITDWGVRSTSAS